MTINERGPEGDRSYAAVADRLAMPLVEAMETQRAVRRVFPDPVDDQIVVRCIELALRAPTGSNSQSWEFVIVRDREVRAAFATQYRIAWGPYRERAEAREPSPSMLKILDAVQWQVDHFEEIPVLVVACLSSDGSGRGAPEPQDPPIVASSFYGSIYPSVQNLLLAARSFGLGASLITLPLWSLPTTRHILHLPETVTPACIVPLGWPRGRYGPTTRRPVTDVIHRDRYRAAGPG